ncbi:MAG TPA: hypothetical protein VIL28_10670 [Steroidobacteraceae bacterium]
MSARRRSRWTIIVARWALMAGIAGVVLAALAFTDRLSNASPSQGRDVLMMMSAVLLSISFVLAPIVRRAFDTFQGSAPRHGERRTLLDEMRELPEEAWNERARSETSPTPREGGARKLVARVITTLYVVFALVLVTVVFTM